MPFKFFRPWEDNGEASTSQASTYHHGSAAQASEAEKQPQVHSGWILQPAQRADSSNSLLSLEPLAGSIRIDGDAVKSDGDTDCHADSRTQELLHDLDNTCKSTCSAGPSTHGSGTRFPFIFLKQDPSLANASHMICTQNVTPVVESFMTFDVLRNSSNSSCPSNLAGESDFCVNVTPVWTRDSGQNLAIAKGSNGLDESTSVDKAFDGQSEHFPFELDHDIVASSNVDGQKCRTQSKLFKCTLCNKTFSTCSNLSVHKRTHTGSKPFKCKFCEKHFTQSSNLQMHERTHTGSKPFHCKFCGKEFAQSSNVRVHERTHTGSKPFKCQICEKAFTHSSHLHSHERTHTGSKPFQCKFCGKEFAQSSNVHVHERTHTGSKPFKCRFCEKAFTHSSHLHSHERTHTGCKPFQCTVCTKTFTQSSSLQVHQRIHTGYRPFQCRICGKDFIQSSGLHRHEHIHTGSKPFNFVRNHSNNPAIFTFMNKPTEDANLSNAHFA